MSKVKSLVQAMIALTGIGFGSAHAGLIGDTIGYQIGWSGFTPLISTNLPLSGSFVAGAGVEIAGQHVDYSFLSSGFPQTMTGTVSIDVDDASIFVSFDGTAQAGALFFNFTGIDDTILGISTTGTGQMSGVNDFLQPSFDTGSVSNMGFFLFGFQPGTSMTQTASLQLSSVPAPGTLALVGLALGLLARAARRGRPWRSGPGRSRARPWACRRSRR